MRGATRFTIGVALLAGSGLTGAALTLAQTDMVQVHIGHVMDGFKDTPDGQGLLPTALAEARIAIQHAGLAAKTPDNLDQMKLHAGHVIHAVDPTVEAKGPGLGYGVKRAAAGVAQHAELAGGADGASEHVKIQGLYVGRWATNVVSWSEEAVSLAERIRAATSAAAAARYASDLVIVTEQLVSGIDAVGRFDPQGGLQQALERMELMKKGDGR